LTPAIAFLASHWMLSTTWFSVTKIKKKYQGGLEVDITLLLASLALTFLGGGTFSIDHLIGLLHKPMATAKTSTSQGLGKGEDIEEKVRKARQTAIEMMRKAENDIRTKGKSVVDKK